MKMSSEGKLWIVKRSPKERIVRVYKKLSFLLGMKRSSSKKQRKISKEDRSANSKADKAAAAAVSIKISIGSAHQKRRPSDVFHGSERLIDREKYGRGRGKT